jgi:Spy/CpxP family protein refolding chaperone
MKPTMYRRLLCVTFVAAATSIAGAQTPAAHAPQAPAAGTRPPQAAAPQTNATRSPQWWWWRSDSYRKEIGLTAEQSARLDHIWDEATPKLREEATQLDERETRLSRLIETNVEEQIIAHQIDRVEAARSTLNKDRQLMLLHMRAVLTPDQRMKFNERWVRDREAQPRPPAQSSGTRPPASAAPGQRQQGPPAGTAPSRRPD